MLAENYYPIIVQELMIPTVTIHNRCRNMDEVEKLCKQRKLDIISCVMYDDWMVIVATAYPIQKVETII